MYFGINADFIRKKVWQILSPALVCKKWIEIISREKSGRYVKRIWTAWKDCFFYSLHSRILFFDKDFDDPFWDFIQILP